MPLFSLSIPSHTHPLSSTSLPYPISRLHKLPYRSPETSFLLSATSPAGNQGASLGTQLGSALLRNSQLSCSSHSLRAKVKYQVRLLGCPSAPGRELSGLSQQVAPILHSYTGCHPWVPELSREPSPSQDSCGHFLLNLASDTEPLLCLCQDYPGFPCTPRLKLPAIHPSLGPVLCDFPPGTCHY